METYGTEGAMWLISICITILILLGAGALYILVEYIFCRKYKR